MNHPSISNIREQFAASHEVLLKSLSNISTEEDFKGSVWSVSDILMHLDLSKFVDALQDIYEGKADKFPTFGTLDSAIEKYLEIINGNHLRLTEILMDLDDELLDKKVTEYNPDNNYPALSLRDLLDRMSRHELNHANQIEEVVSRIRQDS